MKLRLTHSFGAKAAACFLLLLFAFLAFAGTFLTLGMVNDEYYTYGRIFQRSLEEYNADMAEYGFNYRRIAVAALHPYRYTIPAAAAALLLAVIALWVFLLAGAGRRRGRAEAVRNLQDRIPFDIYLALAAFAAYVLLYCLVCIGEPLHARNIQGVLHALLTALVFTGFTGILLAFTATLAARIKTKTLLRNTVAFMLHRLLWKGLCAIGRGSRTFFENLSVLWKASLLFLVYAFSVCLLIVTMHSTFVFLLFVGVNLAAFVFVAAMALQADKLKKGAKRLAAGDFTNPIQTGFLWGEFKRHGEDLNSIGSGMNRAVEARIKSERLKTELITNVSHDIKTPLTSILNYVDLLKKEPEGSEKAAEYLGVIDRQAHRLKKMTEDVVEASKASTGNIRVEPALVDAAELLDQCLGEYRERFDAAKLAVVVQKPEAPLMIMADGRLLSRVLDNLLGNAAKYAQPETRVYASLSRDGRDAVLSLKNVSKEPLNMSEEELMERFVRGDSARSSEGSGLGLSIARSLTQLQGGRFSVSIDCDLFKAELRFAAAENAAAAKQ